METLELPGLPRAVRPPSRRRQSGASGARLAAQEPPAALEAMGPVAARPRLVELVELAGVPELVEAVGPVARVRPLQSWVPVVARGLPGHRQCCLSKGSPVWATR